SSRRRHTRFSRDWSSDVCSSDLYLIGAGKTAYAVKQELGIDGTLLGVDVVCDNQLVLKDATEPELYALVTEKPCRLILSFIGGRSEERRVGKECRCGRGRCQEQS